MRMRGRRCSADEAMSRSGDMMVSLCEGGCCAVDPFETIVRAMGRSYLALERRDAAFCGAAETIGGCMRRPVSSIRRVSPPITRCRNPGGDLPDLTGDSGVR